MRTKEEEEFEHDADSDGKFVARLECHHCDRRGNYAYPRGTVLGNRVFGIATTGSIVRRTKCGNCGVVGQLRRIF